MPALWCRAQSAEVQLQEKLLHQPLYLRGFWMGYSLDFDASGTPIGKPSDLPRRGPLTLSGIEVLDVSVKGTKLVLHAERVALVADARGVLERRPLLSTTLMFGTMKKQYRAKEMIKISIQADREGSFDAPLRAVFANGLGELAASTPTSWRCYAAAYFVVDPSGRPPADSLRACIQESIYSSSRDDDTPPAIATQPRPHGTREAAELQVSGETSVAIRIDARGTPIGYQIVRPLGAGLDEDTLQALSECHYLPATRGGVPVTGGFDFSMQYRER
jgi:hypothetical protein